MHAAVTAFSSTGIDVHAGAQDAVVLRNLYLTGLGGDTGIHYGEGAALHVESVTVAGFDSDGLLANAVDGNLFVRDSMFRGNDFDGIHLSGDSLRAEISESRADLNQDGFEMTAGATVSIIRSEATRNDLEGFLVRTGARLVITDSVSDSNENIGINVLDPTSKAGLTGVVLSDNKFEGLNVGLGDESGPIRAHR